MHDNGAREEGTQGDSFIVAFNSTSSYVAAALAIQHSLIEHTQQNDVRISLCTDIRTGMTFGTSTVLVGYEFHGRARVAAVGP